MGTKKLPEWNGEVIRSNARLKNCAGCLTLLGEDIYIKEAVHLDDRGHLAVLGHKNLPETIMIGNVYAPVRDQSSNQLRFFTNLNDELKLLKSRWSVDRSFIMGDLNLDLTMSQSEIAKLPKLTRLTFVQLDNIINKNKLNYLADEITYQNRGQGTYSKLDFILFNSMPSHSHTQNVSWTLTKSDHAAVIADFKPRTKGSKIKAPRISAEWFNNKTLVE
ncbi:MAG: hypothetical protein FJ333_09365, partial [Sphingomonadales bacterium]|nr:hypothetical protein [Sphingomonadales bacterium]